MAFFRFGAVPVAQPLTAPGILFHSAQASMLVTYVYQADDEPAPPPSPTKSPQKTGSAPEVKSFSFWTLIPLGTVVPRATDLRRMGSGTAPM